MGNTKKSNAHYREENESIRKRPLKKESRQNLKTHLMDAIEQQNWDELDEYAGTETRINRW
jgi:hypothetical protein